MSENNQATHRIRGILNSPPSEHALDLFAGFVLAVWVFGRIVFVHSTASGAAWATEIDLMAFINAIVAGCLIAIIASRGFDFELSEIALLFFLLVGALVLWSKTGDTSLAVLALLLVALKGADIRKMMRFYAVSAFIALTVAIAISFSFQPEIEGFTVKNALLGRYAFAYSGVIACLLLSILVAVALASDRGSVVRKLAIAACVLCAVAAFLPLHAKRGAVFMLAFAVCVFLDEKRPAKLIDILPAKWIRLCVAALPIVLFCITNDFSQLFGIAPVNSGYTHILFVYGFLGTVCLAVLFVFSVLAGEQESGNYLPWAAIALFAVCLVFEAQPIYLEFNCTLLLLSAWMGKAKRDLRIADNQNTENEIVTE